MRLWVKPDQLSKLGITVPDVVSAIQTQNTVNPAGQVGSPPAPKGQECTYLMRAQGRLPRLARRIRKHHCPRVAHRRNCSRARRGAPRAWRAGLYTLSGRINGKPRAVIAVCQLPGTNAVDTAKGVRKLMEEAKKRSALTRFLTGCSVPRFTLFVPALPMQYLSGTDCPL
jgi:HAE1 family hydrophobic/amphiphilic exporter-1